MKSYTDLEQSKKLAEILPIESADMWWVALNWQETEYYVEVKQDGISQPKKAVPCWSLAALLGVLPFVDFTMPQLIGTPKTLYRCIYNDDFNSHAYNNPIDACYEMIIKLHELNLL